LNLDFFACFSSMTSLIGAAGAASYAAANSFIDSLMAYRKSLGMNAQAINWCAWEEVGMLTRLNEAAQDYWRESGMQALPSEVALGIFEKLSKSTASNIAVLPANWDLWNKQYERLPSVLIGLEVKSDETELVQVNRSPIGTQKQANRNDDIHLLVSNSIRKVLRLDSSSLLNDYTSFKEMGIDSLMSVELRNILSKSLGIKLSSTLLYNYSNIHSLTEHLTAESATKKIISSVQPVETIKPEIDTKSLLQEQLKSLLRLNANTAIDEQESFKNMGIDSLMSVELRNKLSKALGIKLSSTLLFNYTNVSLLAEHLHQLINQHVEKTSEIKSQKITPTEVAHEKMVTPTQKLDQEQELSIEKLRSLLDEKLMEEMD
jgi:acyl carrier protein